MGKGFLKKINREFKNSWWKVLLLDLGFLGFMWAFLYYARMKVMGYLVAVEMFGSSVAAVQPALQNQEGMAQLANIMSAIGPIASRAYLFMFLFVPAVVLLAWVVFEGSAFRIVAGKKVSGWKYILGFAAVSVPSMVVVALLLGKVINKVSGWAYGYGAVWGAFVFLLLAVLVLYLMFVMYSLLPQIRFLRIVDSSVSLAVRSFHMIFPLFLAYMFIGFLVALGWLGVWIRVLSWTPGFLLPFCFMAAMLVLCGWVRVLLVFVAQERFKK